MYIRPIIAKGNSFLNSISLIFLSFSSLLKWITFWPSDPTFIFFGTLVFLVIYKLFDNKLRIHISTTRYLLIGILFFIWYAFTSIYTYSDLFWQKKLIVQLLNLTCLISPVILFNNFECFFEFINLFRFLSISISISILFFYFYGFFDFIYYQGWDKELTKIPDYLAIGNFIALGFIQWIYSKNNFKYISLILHLMALLVLTGRGPIFLLILSIILFNSLNLRFKKHIKRKFVYLLIFIFIFTTGLYFWEGSNISIQRFIIFSSGLETRFDLFKDSFASILSNPIFGIGIGGYGKFTYNTDVNEYPHNILLEVFSEAGFIGLLIFCLFISFGFLLIKRYGSIKEKLINNENIRGIFFICFIFLFLSYMKSGGLISARDLFLFYGLVLSYNNIYQLKRFNNDL
tara:strand:+ start:5954 stop:7159 length:1206 start_codon:yes stop_codon:yes gene_type:complete